MSGCTDADPGSEPPETPLDRLLLYNGDYDYILGKIINGFTVNGIVD